MTQYLQRARHGT